MGSSPILLHCESEIALGVVKASSTKSLESRKGLIVLLLTLVYFAFLLHHLFVKEHLKIVAGTYSGFDGPSPQID